MKKKFIIHYTTLNHKKKALLVRPGDDHVLPPVYEGVYGEVDGEHQPRQENCQPGDTCQKLIKR